MLAALKHNLRQLLVFSGRTRPLHFWLYAAVIVLGGQAVSMVAMSFAMDSFFGSMAQFARDHPDQMNAMAVPDGAAPPLEVNPPDMISSFEPFLIVTAVVAVATVLLLAASVTRRLHDSNRRGWWGLLPLPFLAAGLAMFPVMTSNFYVAREPDLDLFLLLFVNNVIYLMLLALLIVLLCFKGTPGKNRFGPPPV